MTKNQTKITHDGNVLECSSKGDIRFSAFGAKIHWNGRLTAIEYIYQGAKRFDNENKQLNWREAKGKKPTHMHVNGVDLPVTYLTAFYKALWRTYLDANPELVSFANTFDDFNDIFKSKKSLNCQADVIRQYVKEGKDSIVADCAPFYDAYRQAKNAQA